MIAKKIITPDLSPLNVRRDWIVGGQIQRGYCQKFLPTDTIRLQYAIPNDVPAPTIKIVNKDTGEVLPTWVNQLFKSPTSYDIRTIEVDPSPTPVGNYLLTFTNNKGAVVDQSEFSVVDEFPGSKLIQYNDDSNALSEYINYAHEAAFSSDLPFFFRVEAEFFPQDEQYKTTRNDFRDQFEDPNQLSAEPYTVKVLTIGAADGVPNWVMNKLNRIFSCSEVYIDGVRFVASEGAEAERKELVPGMPLFVFKYPLEQDYDGEWIEDVEKEPDTPTPIQYALTYSLPNATPTTVTKYYNAGMTVSLPADPTALGFTFDATDYSFGGWTRNEIIVGQVVMNSDITVYGVMTPVPQFAQIFFAVTGATPTSIAVTVPAGEEYILPSAEALGFTAMPAGQAFDYWEVTAGAGQVTSITPTADGTYNFVGKMVAVVQGETRIIVTANLNSTSAAVFEQQDDGTKTKLHDFQLQYPLFSGGLWASPSGKYIFTFENTGTGREINRYVRGSDDNFTFYDRIGSRTSTLRSIDLLPLSDDDIIEVRTVSSNIFVNRNTFSETDGTWSNKAIGNSIPSGHESVLPSIAHICALVDTPQMGQLIFVPTLYAGGTYGIVNVAAQTTTAKNFTDELGGIIHQFAAVGNDHLLGISGNPSVPTQAMRREIFDLSGTDIPAPTQLSSYNSLQNELHIAGMSDSTQGFPYGIIRTYNNIVYGDTGQLAALNTKDMFQINGNLSGNRIAFSPLNHKLLYTQNSVYPYARTFQINADGSYTQQPTASGSPTAPCAACWVPNVTT